MGFYFFIVWRFISRTNMFEAHTFSDILFKKKTIFNWNLYFTWYDCFNQWSQITFLIHTGWWLCIKTLWGKERVHLRNHQDCMIVPATKSAKEILLERKKVRIYCHFIIISRVHWLKFVCISIKLSLIASIQTNSLSFCGF